MKYKVEGCKMKCNKYGRIIETLTIPSKEFDKFTDAWTYYNDMGMSHRKYSITLLCYYKSHWWMIESQEKGVFVRNENVTFPIINEPIGVDD